MVSFFRRMKACRTAVQKDNDPEGSRLFQQLKKAILEKYSKFNAQLLVIDLTSEEAAKRLNSTAARVRSNRKYLSDQLYQKLGIDFFDKFTAKDYQDIKNRLQSFQGKWEETLPLELISYIDELDDEYTGKYELEDCQREIKFLLDHSIPQMHDEAMMLDGAKLKYLFAVLRDEVGDARQKGALVDKLNG